MSHLATQEKLFLFFPSKNTVLIYAHVIFLDREEGEKNDSLSKYVLFTCQSKGLTKSRTLITTGYFLPSLLMASLTASSLSDSLFPATNSKMIKLPILDVSGLCTKAALSAFHLLRCIQSVWHSLPVCCHAAPHLAPQEVPDCSWAGHREVINGLPYFKRQPENIGGTMQAVSWKLDFHPICLHGTQSSQS